MKKNDCVILYTYDADGTLISFNYDNNEYFYVKDLLGNIIRIIDDDGTTLVEYQYDAYGNALHVIDTSGTLGLSSINPYTYRGYRYDHEISYYYCNARYYQPLIGRWLNADHVGFLDPEGASGLNLFAYCGNNPIMYSDPSGNMPEWLKWTLGVGVIVIAVGLSIVTAGLAAPIAAGLGGGLIGAIVGGAVAGAIGGTITGLGISIGMQGITNGFDAINWSEVGKAAASGAISGFIAGGVFGGIKHLTSFAKVANNISGLGKAQSNLNSAFSPLNNVKSLTGTFSSGTNITRVVGQAASNYNTAYTALANAQIGYMFAKYSLELIAYKGGQFVLKQAIGYGINMLW